MFSKKSDFFNRGTSTFYTVKIENKIINVSLFFISIEGTDQIYKSSSSGVKIFTKIEDVMNQSKY